MTIIELSEQEIKDLTNGEEIDKTIFVYSAPLILRRKPVMEDDSVA